MTFCPISSALALACMMVAAEQGTSVLRLQNGGRVYLRHW